MIEEIFDEMIAIYREAIPEMKWLGQFDWYIAANQTLRRLYLYLQSDLKATSSQLARECHADLQGYVNVKFDVNLMQAQECQQVGCFKLYLIGQDLVQIGGLP